MCVAVRKSSLSGPWTRKALFHVVVACIVVRNVACFWRSPFLPLWVFLQKCHLVKKKKTLSLAVAQTRSHLMTPDQGWETPVHEGRCPVCLRCCPAITRFKWMGHHQLVIKVWTRLLRLAGQQPSRTGFAHPCSRYRWRVVLVFDAVPPVGPEITNVHLQCLWNFTLRNTWDSLSQIVEPPPIYSSKTLCLSETLFVFLNSYSCYWPVAN